MNKTLSGWVLATPIDSSQAVTRSVTHSLPRCKNHQHHLSLDQVSTQYPILHDTQDKPLYPPQKRRRRQLSYTPSITRSFGCLVRWPDRSIAKDKLHCNNYQPKEKKIPYSCHGRATLLRNRGCARIPSELPYQGD